MNKISVAVVDDNEKIVETICNELENQSWCCGLGFDNAKDGRIIINEQDT